MKRHIQEKNRKGAKDEHRLSRNLATEGVLPEGVPEFVSDFFSGDLTKEQMQERINLLSSEIDANEEENSVMQAEITAVYKKLDALKI